jgi:hypothetical protein
MTEPRLKRSVDDDRTARLDDRIMDSRAMDDRAMTEDRAMSDQDLREMLRNQLAEMKLPNVRLKPGLHGVWLSTTNESDTIASRMRLGYTPATKDDVLGDDAQLEVAEMRLFKISEQRYQTLMYLQHEEAPRESERDIKARAKAGDGKLRGRIAEESGGHESGFDIEERPYRRPHFA